MTSTTQLILMITVMLTINIAMFYTQEAMFEVNPTGVQFYDSTDSPYEQYAATVGAVGDGSIPSADGVTATDTGDTFTDTYGTAKSWIQSDMSTDDNSLLGSIFNQPYKFLKSAKLPLSICISMQVLWYLIALIIVVSWLLGR